jgi:CCR4-NOT transcription complex subunit 1
MDNPPNNNIHTIVRAQIVFLLSTLTEDNFDRNQAEIRSVRLAISVMGSVIPIS